MSFTNNFKKIWNWIWNSNSIWSWLVALAVIFIFVKFIFFPTLSFIFATPLPLAGVESSSMDHQIVTEGNALLLCGKPFLDRKYLNFDEYWNVCGEWYKEREISKEEFSKFSMREGFAKGDILIVWGRFTPKVGDVIIFQ